MPISGCARPLSANWKPKNNGSSNYNRSWCVQAVSATQMLQTLADRIRTASYGYAGLFDAVRIKEDQLDALHRFDVAMAARTYEISQAITRVEDAFGEREGVDDAIDALLDKLTELNRLYDERHRAVLDPALLTGENAPVVEEDWMKAADQYADDEAS
jgi:hypothetical protein